jgi:peptide-methionine (R)-S-oxide reductase
MMRRQFLQIAAGAAALLSGHSLFRRGSTEAIAAAFEVTKTDAEWKAQLGEDAYQVLRHEATEYAGSSPLNNEKRKGMFHCAGCDLPVYSSEAKYDSGTGWPSFWESVPDAIGT